MEDSCWHGNDITKVNGVEVTLDKRNEEDLTTAVLNGIDSCLTRDKLNEMGIEHLAMGSG